MLDDCVYENLAIMLMAYNNFTFDDFVNHANKAGLTLRKGVTEQDVRNAVRKARDPKRGFYKTELEVGMLSTYLKHDILKHIS